MAIEYVLIAIVVGAVVVAIAGRYGKRLSSEVGSSASEVEETSVADEGGPLGSRAEEKPKSLPGMKVSARLENLDWSVVLPLAGLAIAGGAFSIGLVASRIGGKKKKKGSKQRGD